MIDVDSAIKDELERWIEIDATPDWEAVERASTLQGRRSRRALVLAAVAAAAIAVVAATPLGAAVARGFGGFSDWITGAPGTPASKRAQSQFANANAQSWLHFPADTQLRHLITRRVGDATVALYGFRSGSSLCLRVTVSGTASGGGMECAPVTDLQRADAPARVVIADRPFGRGTKAAWYGLDRLRAPRLQVTAGVAADGVRRIVVTDRQGRHQLGVSADAFLYVADDPDVGQRVTAVSARTARGLVAVPYTPVPFAMGGQATAAKPPTIAVTSPARNGRIGWLERRETRGQPLTVLPARLRRSLLGYRGGGARTRIVFGRVLTPDPSTPVRVALTLNARRAGGRVAGICMTTVLRDGAGGGCSPYPGVFAKSPISQGEFGGGSGQFVDVGGMVSDAVARLRAVLANQQWIDLPLADNTFDVQLPLAHLPARLVAYDRSGRIIGVGEPIESFAGRTPAQSAGRARQLLAVRGPNGSHEELFVGPATAGGECMYVKHWFSSREVGSMEGCFPQGWTGVPVQLSTDENPPVFFSGRVRDDVAHVRVVFADGDNMLVTPTRGFVLGVVPSAHRSVAGRPVKFIGLSKAGQVVGTEKLPPLPKRSR